MASPNPEGNENKNRSTAKQQPARPDKKVGARETASLSHVESVEAEICTACNEYRAKEYAHWNRQTFWQRWSTIFTGFAFVAAAIYAHYASQQVGAMQDTLTQTISLAQSAATQAAAVPSQIAEMKRSNTIAQASVDNAHHTATEANQIARDTLTETERPWIGFGTIDVVAPPTKDKALHVRIAIQNGGHSPALNLFPHWVFKPWLYPRGDTQIPLMREVDIRVCTQPKPKWSVDLGGGIILPGAPGMIIEPESPILNETVVGLITKTSGTYHYGPFGIANSPELANIGRAPASANTTDWLINLYLVGCVDYFDEWHHAHRTFFSMIWAPSSQSPNGALGAWTVGNSAD